MPNKESKYIMEHLIEQVKKRDKEKDYRERRSMPELTLQILTRRDAIELYLNMVTTEAEFQEDWHGIQHMTCITLRSGFYDFCVISEFEERSGGPELLFRLLHHGHPVIEGVGVVIDLRYNFMEVRYTEEMRVDGILSIAITPSFPYSYTETKRNDQIPPAPNRFLPPHK